MDGAGEELAELGITLEYVPADDQVDPAVAPTVARKLIQDEAVVGVVGPIFSSTTTAAAPLFTEANMGFMSISSATELTTHGWSFNRLEANDDRQGTTIAEYAARTLGLKTIAVVDDGSLYGSGLASVVATVATDNGMTVTTREQIDQKADDYSAAISKILANGADAVFLGAGFTIEAAFNRQLREKGYDGVFFAPGGSLNTDYVAQAGPGSEGTYFTCPCAPAPAFGGPASGALADFVSAYTDAYSEPPQAYAAESFDAANLIIAALKAGRTDRAGVLAHVREANFEGVTKTYAFEPNGELKGAGVNIYQVKSGEIRWLGTSEELIQ